MLSAAMLIVGLKAMQSKHYLAEICLPILSDFLKQLDCSTWLNLNLVSIAVCPTPLSFSTLVPPKVALTLALADIL